MTFLYHRTVSKQTASGGRERVRFSDDDLVVGRITTQLGWFVIPLAFASPAGGRMEPLQWHHATCQWTVFRPSGVLLMLD